MPGTIGTIGFKVLYFSSIGAIQYREYHQIRAHFRAGNSSKSKSSHTNHASETVQFYTPVTATSYSFCHGADANIRIKASLP